MKLLLFLLCLLIPLHAPDQEAGGNKSGGTESDIPVSTSVPPEPVPSPIYGSCDSPCEIWVGEPLPTIGTFGGLRPIADSWRYGIAAGIASHVGSRFPWWYLALPIGPGFRVRIVGAGGSVTRVSTDAGPALHMQRAPYFRVADLSVTDFVAVCGVSTLLGLCPVSVTVIGRT